MFSTTINSFLSNVPGYLGTFPRDQLPLDAERGTSLIINTDSSDGPGEHWVAVYVDDKDIEYFDPYGLPPFHEEIASFLERNGRRITINHVTLQTPGYSVTCGHYACLFVLFRGRGLEYESLLRMFTGNTFLNDIKVKELLGDELLPHEH